MQGSVQPEGGFKAVLRPRPGVVPSAVPPFRFVFFDPDAGRYETIESDALTLPKLAPGAVVPNPGGTVPSPSGAVGMSEAQPVRDLDVRGLIASVPESANWVGPRPWLAVLPWVLHGGGVVACGLLAGWVARRRYLAGERGKLAVLRAGARRDLRRLFAIPDAAERDLACLRWFEAWKAGPLARPLRPHESDAVQALARRVEAARYAAAPTLPPSPALAAGDLSKLLKGLVS